MIGHANPGDRLFRVHGRTVKGKSFSAGVTVAANGRITMAAPVLKAFYNLNLDYLREVSLRRGWKIEECGR